MGVLQLAIAISGLMITTVCVTSAYSQEFNINGKMDSRSYKELSAGVNRSHPVQGKHFWFTLVGCGDNPALDVQLRLQPIADPGFCSAGVGEWEYSFFNIPPGASDGSGTVINGGYNPQPADRRDAFNQVKKFYLNMRSNALAKATPAQRKTFMSFNGHYCFQHYGCEWGCDIVGSEIGENINSAQAHVAFTRGAARQYGKPWAMDFSSWYGPGIYDEDPAKTWKDMSSPVYGHSVSLHIRSYYMSYMAGANVIVAEGGSANYFKSQTPGPDGMLPLSTLGTKGAEFYRFTKRHPDRGVPYAPIALLIDFYHGIYPGFGDKKAWYIFPYTEGDQRILDVWNTFWPGSEVVMPKQDEKEYMVASPYGDIVDVFLTNAPANVLDNYPVVILSGNLSPDAALSKRLSSYLSHGGTLVLHESDVDKGFPRDGRVIVYGSKQPLNDVVRGLRNSLIPIDVSGKVQTLYNRAADGWAVTIINNEGITKAYHEAPVTNPRLAQDVTVSYRGTGSISSAKLWGADSDTDLDPSKVHVIMPPGEVRIVKLVIR